MKPTPDALAAGIFCDENQDPRAVARFAFDDSNFTYLFRTPAPGCAYSRSTGEGPRGREEGAEAT